MNRKNKLLREISIHFLSSSLSFLKIVKSQKQKTLDIKSNCDAVASALRFFWIAISNKLDPTQNRRAKKNQPMQTCGTTCGIFCDFFFHPLMTSSMLLNTTLYIALKGSNRDETAQTACGINNQGHNYSDSRVMERMVLGMNCCTSLISVLTTCIIPPQQLLQQWWEQNIQSCNNNLL